MVASEKKINIEEKKIETKMPTLKEGLDLDAATIMRVSRMLMLKRMSVVVTDDEAEAATNAAG